MMKIYAFILSACLLSFSGQAANRFWVGASGGNWSNPNNWSATSGGAGGAGVPTAGDDVIFNTTTDVNIDPASITILSLRVTNSVTVRLYTSISTSITVTSTSTVTPGLRIDAGNTLRDSSVNSVAFNFIFNSATNARGIIDGTWSFGGRLTGGPGPGFSAPSGSIVDVNGTVTFYPNSGIINAASGSTLNFNASSFYTIARDGGVVPSNATWNTTSTINVTGSVDALPSFFDSPPSYGNLIINTPALSSDNSLNLPDGTTVKGDLQILNTNGMRLALLTNIPAVSPINLNVNKSFTVSGATSIAVLSSNDGPDPAEQYLLDVDQNFTVTNATFSMQDNNGVTGSTTLRIGGNFAQSGGSFAVPSTASSSADNYFIVEFDGAAPQTISTTAGVLNNAQNMVQLRMNNSGTGVTLLTPLVVGRISFIDGVLTTTGTNLLTINDPPNTAVVVGTPSAASYVSGPVARRMAAATTYLMPTGKGANYHSIEITPTAATASLYTAEYFNTGYGDYTVVLPLSGVSNTEYWNVTKGSGADATIRLSLNGTAVPGANFNDGIVVARFNTTDWVSERGATGTFISPGNATTGNAVTQTQTAFGFYTFGYAPISTFPVKLKNLSVQKVSSTAVLDWEMDLATVAESFEVLKSADGRNFTYLGTVKGSNNISHYKFTDSRLTTGNNYYRLKMIEKDGSFALSKIVVVVNKKDGVEISSMMPTLVSDRAKLAVASADGGHLELHVTDMSGRVWRKLGVTVSAGNSDVWLNLHDLSAGVYQITGYMNGSNTSSIRFVKQ